MMYVVRRAFRNFGNVLTPGSFVEPGNVKRFKYRLQERYIVAITDDNFDTWKAYFKDKFGVDLACPAAETATPAKVSTATTNPTTGVAKPAPVKTAAAKATAK